MKILTFINGPLFVNTYLIFDNINAIVIDPGHECSQLIKYLIKKNFKSLNILLTHGHLDHIAGVAILKKQFPGIQTYINENDNIFLLNIELQSQLLGMPECEQFSIDYFLNNEKNIKLSGFSIEILHTPGHSKGSLSFKIDNYLFSGDVLFKHTIGRTDLMGGNFNELITSIKSKILKLPDKTIIYPGHGEKTSIGEEKKYNFFLKSS